MELIVNKLKGMKIGILVADGFEQIELEKPRLALEMAGAETFIISPEEDTVQGWNHWVKGDQFPVDIRLKDAKADAFDGLLLPGGVINPDRLRTFPEAIELVKTIHLQNKPIAAICHGPWMLINAEVVKDHQVTSWTSIKVDLINAGAKWIDAPVVCDKNLVTSRKPDDIPKFNEAMIQLFHSFHQ